MVPSPLTGIASVSTDRQRIVSPSLFDQSGAPPRPAPATPEKPFGAPSSSPGAPEHARGGVPGPAAMVGGEWVEVVRRRHRTSPAAAAAAPPAGRPQHVQPPRAAPGGSAPRGGQQAGQRQYSRPAVRAAAAAAASPPIPVQPLVIRDLPPHSRVLLKACIPAGFSVQHALSQLAPAAIDAVNSLIAAAGNQDAQSSCSDVVVGSPFAIIQRTGPGGQRVPVAVAVAFTLPPSTGSLLLSHGSVALPDPWPASEPPALLTDSKPPAE